MIGHGRSAGAVLARAVEDDLVFADAHPESTAEALDRVLEPSVGERGHGFRGRWRARADGEAATDRW
jgi:hypothetical protein